MALVEIVSPAFDVETHMVYATADNFTAAGLGSLSQRVASLSAFPAAVLSPARGQRGGNRHNDAGIDCASRRNARH